MDLLGRQAMKFECPNPINVFVTEILRCDPSDLVPL